MVLLNSVFSEEMFYRRMLLREILYLFVYEINLFFSPVSATYAWFVEGGGDIV